jgi:hypothetical protein
MKSIPTSMAFPEFNRSSAKQTEHVCSSEQTCGLAESRIELSGS